MPRAKARGGLGAMPPARELVIVVQLAGLGRFAVGASLGDDGSGDGCVVVRGERVAQGIERLHLDLGAGLGVGHGGVEGVHDLLGHGLGGAPPGCVAVLDQEPLLGIAEAGDAPVSPVDGGEAANGAGVDSGGRCGFGACHVGSLVGVYTLTAPTWNRQGESPK